MSMMQDVASSGRTVPSRGPSQHVADKAQAPHRTARDVSVPSSARITQRRSPMVQDPSASGTPHHHYQDPPSNHDSNTSNPVSERSNPNSPPRRARPPPAHKNGNGRARQRHVMPRTNTSRRRRCSPTMPICGGYSWRWRVSETGSVGMGRGGLGVRRRSVRGR